MSKHTNPRYIYEFAKAARKILVDAALASGYQGPEVWQLRQVQFRKGQVDFQSLVPVWRLVHVLMRHGLSNPDSNLGLRTTLCVRAVVHSWKCGRLPNRSF